MDNYELMKEAWDAAVNQCALVQERGWKYTPLTFDQWFTLNHTCNAGHHWQPVIGMDNITGTGGPNK